jgi:hypothetical protein
VAPASPHRRRQAEGGYTEGFEIICCDCGDDSGLDYRDVPPRLQLIRGPYPIKDGVAAYNQHGAIAASEGPLLPSLGDDPSA